jgi:hypothetical protein
MFRIGEFKGKAVISLKQKEGDKYGIAFGVSKAKLILDHVEAIKKFYDGNKDAAPVNAAVTAQ